jgi:hypothetical protein
MDFGSDSDSDCKGESRKSPQKTRGEKNGKEKGENGILPLKNKRKDLISFLILK